MKYINAMKGKRYICTAKECRTGKGNGCFRCAWFKQTKKEMKNIRGWVYVFE